MSNSVKYYLNIIMSTIGVTLVGGVILQTFLLESGLSEESVGILTSVMQAVQVAVMITLSKKVDETDNVIVLSAYARLCDLPLIVTLFGLCFFTPQSSLLFILSLTVLLIYSVGIGITNITSYKLPYLVMPVEDYGKVTAIGGIIAAIATSAISLAMSHFQARCNYFSVMKCVFSLAFVAFLIYFFATVRMTATYKAESYNTKKTGSILKYKPFTLLIIPNVLRGFNAGVIGLAVTIGYYVDILDASASAVFVIITNAVTVFAAFVYSQISGKISEKNMLAICGITIFAAAPLMLLWESRMLFFVFYGITYFFYTIVNYAVPSAVVKFVDYDTAGQYNAGRMMLHTLGMSAAGFLCIPLINLIGPLSAMLFAGACQAVSSLGYCIFLKKRGM